MSLVGCVLGYCGSQGRPLSWSQPLVAWPLNGVWSVFGCGGPLNGRWCFCSGIGFPRFGGDFWYLGPGASYAACARKTDREVVDVPPGARVGAESGMRRRNIRADTLVTAAAGA